MRTSFYILAGGFLVGVFWRSIFSVGYVEVGALLFGVLFVFVLITYAGLQTSFAYVVLGVLMTILGAVRTEFAFTAFHEGQVFTDGSTFSGTGVIVSEPDIRDEATVLHVKLDTPQSKNETRVRLKVPHYPAFSYGDRLLIEGEVHVPVSFETETGRVFNYKGYLMKDNIQYEVRQAQVTDMNENVGNPLVKKLLTLKTAWLSAVSQILPEPSASLVAGVVVGAKQSLGEDWLSDFRAAGIVHIIVLSGYNLTLVANSILRVTTFLPRTVGFGLGVFGIASFAMMVGAGATVLRASVMAVLGMLATFLKRPYLVFRALVLAGLGMVIWNPFILVFDPGFQLSFLATIGLIFLSSYFAERLVHVPALWGTREIIAATFATQLTVLPLLLYQIGTVSLVAPVVNVLVLPIVPPVMFFGFIAGGLGMCSTVLATPFAALTHVFLSYIFVIVKFFASLPLASVSIPYIHWGFMLGAYGLVFLWCRAVYKNHPNDVG